MDQANAYGMPPTSGAASSQGGGAGPSGGPSSRSMGMQPPGGNQRGMMPTYMGDMMFDPIGVPMNTNGMYHQDHRAMPPSMQMLHHPGVVAPPPEDDSRFVDDIMIAFPPTDLSDPVGMGVPAHMRQVPYNHPQMAAARNQPPVPLGSQAPPPPQSHVPMQSSSLSGPRIPTSMAPPSEMSLQPPHQGVNPMQMQQQQRMGPGGMAPPPMAVPPATSSMRSSEPSVAPSIMTTSNSSMPSMTRGGVAPPSAPPAMSFDSKSSGHHGGLSSMSSTLSRTSAGGSGDDEMGSSTALTVAGSSGLGGGENEDDDSTKKKERRRQQVRYASRRRRKKQKDEESFLRDRIEELKEQIRIIGGDIPDCSQVAGMSEQALAEAYDKQMQTVQNLRNDNNKLKEQLLQHEQFARMIQNGLNNLPSDCRDTGDRKRLMGGPMWMGDQMGNMLNYPAIVVDLGLIRDAVREAYNLLNNFRPDGSAKTNVCYAMGWKTELWATNTCLNFRAVRTISERKIEEVTAASWGILTAPEKCKRIYPDVKQFRVLQKVDDDTMVLHRIASVASDMSDREFVSVAFRLNDGNKYFVGMKSIDVKSSIAQNAIRGEECQGWMFTAGNDPSAPWKASFLGYYDVKGERDDKILNQLANEAMFGMLRWESEAMHPLSS